MGIYIREKRMPCSPGEIQNKFGNFSVAADINFNILQQVCIIMKKRRVDG